MKTCVEVEAKLDIREYYSTHCVVKVWNSLPQYVVESPDIDSFKRRLDQTWI